MLRIHARVRRPGLNGDEAAVPVGKCATICIALSKRFPGWPRLMRRSKTTKPATGRTLQRLLAVLDRDARDSLAAIQIVLAQAILSSQLIDNLNASIHVRALLTDCFSVDEILKPQRMQAKPAPAS